MVILGRRVSLSKVLPKGYQLISGCVRAFSVFKNPTQMISCYLQKKSPKDGLVHLRNGMTIHTSSHHDDIVTIFVVFCKLDYGKDFADKKIADIGSNIGIFALYAAINGAKRIVSCEPSQEAFGTLEKNVKENGLQDVIIPLNLAVSGEAGQVVKFAVESSPYNQLGSDSIKGEVYDVSTTTMHDIMEEYFPDGIDLLKMDCEGAEFDIFEVTGLEDLRKIDDVRMEYHRSDYPDIIKKLEDAGLSMTFHQPGFDSTTGTLWMQRA